MIYLIDNLHENLVEIDGKWVVARPVNYKYSSLIRRLKSAWEVLRGRADVVKFYKQ